MRNLHALSSRIGWLAPVLLALLASFVGCGESDPRYDITGTVTLDGQPIEQGEISFIPLDDSLGPDGGNIENGKFRVSARPGKKRVAIRASRPLPAERQPADGGIFYEDFLPAKFNDQSTLEIVVSADGPQSIPFDLKSE